MTLSKTIYHLLSTGINHESRNCPDMTEKLINEHTTSEHSLREPLSNKTGLAGTYCICVQQRLKQACTVSPETLLLLHTK